MFWDICVIQFNPGTAQLSFDANLSDSLEVKEDRLRDANANWIACGVNKTVFLLTPIMFSGHCIIGHSSNNSISIDDTKYTCTMCWCRCCCIQCWKTKGVSNWGNTDRGWEWMDSFCRWRNRWFFNLWDPRRLLTLRLVGPISVL